MERCSSSRAARAYTRQIYPEYEQQRQIRTMHHVASQSIIALLLDVSKAKAVQREKKTTIL
jgi:hypothetical protein